MIIVIAEFKAKPGKRDKVVQISQACIEATRREAGCISYELFASTECGEGLVFVEKWKDKGALTAHQQSAHIAAYREERAPYVEGPSDVSLFEASPETL